MNFHFIPYLKKEEMRWDAWCQETRNSTLLHTRKFLNYHGERFKDTSVFIYESEKLVGIFPAAEDPGDASRVVSHPGSTYGGIVHQGWLVGERMIHALKGLKNYYRAQGYLKLLYKVMPHAYALIPSQDDLYALFRLGAKRVRCDLSCVIALDKKRTPSERRLRSLKKANKQVAVESKIELLPQFWQVLLENLKRKHGAKPAHTFIEAADLIEKFPKEIQLYCALINGNIEAGILLFNSTNVWHAQYIASSEVGYAASALDAIFEKAITVAQQNGARYFDFGTSNEAHGQILNEGLYRFKSEFGGGGMVHEYYEIEL